MMYWLILTNYVSAFVLAINLTLTDCEAHTKRINEDFHYRKVIAYCEKDFKLNDFTEEEKGITLISHLQNEPQFHHSMDSSSTK